MCICICILDTFLKYLPQPCELMSISAVLSSYLMYVLINAVSLHDVGGLDEDQLPTGVPSWVFNSRHNVAGRGRRHLRPIVEDGIIDVG